MRTYAHICCGEGLSATFDGKDGKGVYCCSEKIPHTALAQLGGKRFSDVVAIDDPIISWLGPAIIIGADVDDTGTTLHLQFPFLPALKADEMHSRSGFQ